MIGIVLGVATAYLILIVGGAWRFRQYGIAYVTAIILAVSLPIMVLTFPYLLFRRHQADGRQHPILAGVLAIVWTFVYYPDFVNYLGASLGSLETSHPRSWSTRAASGVSSSATLRKATEALIPWASNHRVSHVG
ncbi:hypothetical protein [Sulfobacillus harzensis]|uniref:Uncharacterized protein n=1 Tax=Sulfobacillus harzensis TaxID=2729629 RepID=A0A7Y0L5I8_9FIRM|nr:hypothetical protein [Sulfobacillus harzensis]NMP23428.1 hypothetical protein [Sulfobacillus harzensis]